MTKKALLLAVAVALLASFNGCSASSTSPQPPTPVNATIADPTGDLNTGGVGTEYDITQVTTSRTGPPGGTYSTITVTATFVPNVVLPAAGALPDQTMLGFILAFDINNNFTDGTNYALCGSGGGGTYNGADYIVNGSGGTARLADGNYPIQIQPAGTQTGEATVAASTNTMTWTIPISAIGNVPAGPFNVGVISGNGPAPQDCAANSGYTATSIILHPDAGIQRGIPQGHTYTTWSH